MRRGFGSVDQDFLWKGQKVHLPAGVAHFLEHKMFESEKGDAFDFYAKTGASANAYTGFERTCYVFGATDHLDESLDVLLDFVSHPWFTEATVAKEQGIIGQEIRMYEDSPDWRLMFAVFDCLYHNCPLKVDIAGTVESISEITPALLYTCTDAFYNPGNMVLAAAGRITREQVLAALDRADLPAGGEVGQKIPFAEPREIVRPADRLRMAVSPPGAGTRLQGAAPPRVGAAALGGHGRPAGRAADRGHHPALPPDLRRGAGEQRLFKRRLHRGGVFLHPLLGGDAGPRGGAGRAARGDPPAAPGGDPAGGLRALPQPALRRGDRRV